LLRKGSIKQEAAAIMVNSTKSSYKARDLIQPIIEEADIDPQEAMAKVLVAAVDSEEEAPPQQPSRLKKKLGRKSNTDSSTKLKKFLSLPNVHTGLHLSSIAEEYATVMNLSILAGEIKHISA
ncbi:MAG: hypothetical protein Q9180_007985, partial [Flavoplaca navasiana]